MADIAVAGMTPEQMVLVMELYGSAVAEAASVTKSVTSNATLRTANAERQARYRARQKQREAGESVTDDVTHNAASDDGDVTSVTPTPSPAPSLFLPPDPQPKPTPTHTPATETRARKGTRLAEDWQPEPLSEKHTAMVENWPPGAFVREREKFRNYWLAKSGAGATKTDWQRTWINWLLSADERMPTHGTGNRHQAGSGGHGGQFRDPVFDYLAQSHGS
ncbi:hypothetical protein [Sphingobium amiense]|nr:hypothetical protein [Sphingobium amiense]